MNYREAIDWLYGTQFFGIKLGLENVGRLFDEAGLFQKLAGRAVIHVAGTNGKGSVCAMIDSVLRAAGKRSGLFTSPHLVAFGERIRVNGAMMPETAIAAGLSAIRDRVENWDPHPTFFEIATALAVERFCEAGCEVLVMETGLGGRLDATNILPARVSVITPISMDHQEWLGDSLAEIAAEKAGIIKPGVPVVGAAQDPDAEQVIREVAESAGAPLRWISDPILEGWSLGLVGRHQRENAALAIAAAETLGFDLGETAVREGIATVVWPGRFQVIDQRIVIDGAHNESAAAALVATWRENFGEEKATIVFGGVSLKNTAAIFRELASIATAFVLVPVRSRRGLSLGQLEAIWRGSDITVIPFRLEESLGDALGGPRKPGAGRVLVTGSLFLAGEALAELEGSAPFEISEQ